MSNKFLVFLLTFLLNANLSYALTCKSGDSSCSADGAAECEKLGYAKSDTDGCSHYIYCPFDTGYKTCLSTSSTADTCSGYTLTSCPTNGICENCSANNAYKKLTGCNSGYTLNTAGDGCVATTCSSGYAKTADNCGTTGSKGWSLGTKDANGCGKCTENQCTSGMLESNVGIFYNGATGQDITHTIYVTFTPNGIYSGNTPCGTFALNTNIICPAYLEDKKACGTGLNYDSNYEDIFDACQNGGDIESDCSGLEDCLNEVRNLWKRQFSLDYCSDCSSYDDDNIACL